MTDERKHLILCQRAAFIDGAYYAHRVTGGRVDPSAIEREAMRFYPDERYRTYTDRDRVVYRVVDGNLQHLLGDVWIGARETTTIRTDAIPSLAHLFAHPVLGENERAS